MSLSEVPEEYQGMVEAYLKNAQQRQKYRRAHGLCLSCPSGAPGKMRRGTAMVSTMTGTPDFFGGSVVTVSPGGPGKVVPVLKCNKCGWSVKS